MKFIKSIFSEGRIIIDPCRVQWDATGHFGKTIERRTVYFGFHCLNSYFYAIDICPYVYFQILTYMNEIENNTTLANYV